MGSSSSRKPHSQEQDLAAELEPAEPEAALGEAAELCSEEQCRMPFGWENKIVRMVRSIQPQPAVSPQCGAVTAESDSSSTVAVSLPAVRCCPSSASHSLVGVEVNTQPLDAAAAVNGYQHYNYQREARTAVARRMEVEAQAAAASEENAARAAREEQSFQPTGETAGLGTFPGHFARAPGPEAAPWVNRDGAGEQQQITRYSAEPTFGQTWIQSLPKGVKVSQKEAVNQKLVRPPRPQGLRRQRACGSWPHRAS